MPITATFDRAHDIAVITVTAPYTFNEWKRAMDEVLAARPRPGSFLVDRRQAGVPTTELVDEFVGYFRANADRLSGSTAAVVVGGEAAYGMARMLAIRAEVSRIRITMKIFVEYDDAVRWLNSINEV